MKLAEALLQRSEYQKKIESLKQRIMVNLKVQEGEKPHEDPKQLLDEVLTLSDELCELIKKINRKNNEVKLTDGRTLSEALADRDLLLKKRQMLNMITVDAAQKDYRLTHAEVKMLTTVDIGSLQKEIDRLSMEFRQLDTQIQGQNWLIDLE